MSATKDHCIKRQQFYVSKPSFIHCYYALFSYYRNQPRAISQCHIKKWDINSLGNSVRCERFFSRSHSLTSVYVLSYPCGHIGLSKAPGRLWIVYMRLNTRWSRAIDCSIIYICNKTICTYVPLLIHMSILNLWYFEILVWSYDSV